MCCESTQALWFAQNSLPLRWQRQPQQKCNPNSDSCDLLKIHYLCGDKDNSTAGHHWQRVVVICSKFITFAVTKTTITHFSFIEISCDLLKIHYLCGDKDNRKRGIGKRLLLWFAQNSLPLRWQRQRDHHNARWQSCCDLLKIHYLCGDKDNPLELYHPLRLVVICSKFITFAVTKTTRWKRASTFTRLWFAQNSLPLRWQRQPSFVVAKGPRSCDLLKIHYLCGDKDNHATSIVTYAAVVICSKFITFAVTKTTR